MAPKTRTKRRSPGFVRANAPLSTNDPRVLSAEVYIDVAVGELFDGQGCGGDGEHTARAACKLAQAFAVVLAHCHDEDRARIIDRLLEHLKARYDIGAEHEHGQKGGPSR